MCDFSATRKFSHASLEIPNALAMFYTQYVRINFPILEILRANHKEDSTMSLSENQWVPEIAGPLFLPQYLDKVKEQPQLADNAHQRVCRVIMQEGELGTRNNPYTFFSDHIYGIDRHIAHLVEDYFIPAAHGFEVKKRILLLVGPVSGGKSSLVTLLKRGLERYSRTEVGALWAIADCPMHEDPLNLIPHEMRPTVQERLGIAISGELCPWCQWQLENVYQRNVNQVPLTRVILSESHRIGIGTYAPSDPKSQDIADLTGAADFQGLGQYGSESDPRAFRFDGELNIANRGLVEFQEMLKLDEKFLYQLLSLTQEGNFKTSRYQLISADEVIIGHSNEHEFRAFQQNPRNQALLSRMFIQPIPYNMRVKDEVQIYSKLLIPHVPESVHVSDRALETAATVAVLSRIHDEPKPGSDRLTKFSLYQDDERQAEAEPVQVEALSLGEGLSGLDPRFVINRMAALVAKPHTECLDPVGVLVALRDGITQSPFTDRALKTDVAQWVQTAKTLYDQKIEREVLAAFADDVGDAVERLYQNYVDNVVRLMEGVDDKPGFGGSRSDERLLRSVEERMGIGELQAPAFREEIYTRLCLARERGQILNYLEHPGLRQALLEKLFDDMKDEVKITTKSPVPDRTTLARIEQAATRLVQTGRYCPRCAAQAIYHVGGLLNR